MTTLQLESLWNFMTRWNFPVRLDNEDLICILCKNLLIEAKQAPCACKFCSSCIETYLSDDHLICPGESPDCKDEQLDISVNISTDHVTNRKICKLKVTCPIDSCQYEDTLMNMENHVVLCSQPKIACPYFNIGCDTTAIRRQIVDHLGTDVVDHANLLSKTIDNLKNEIEVLFKQHNQLEENYAKQQLCIEQLNGRIDEICDEFEEEEAVESVTSEDISNTVAQPVSTVAQNKGNNFSWRIENVFTRLYIDEWIDSDKFETHSNGYVMQLRVLPQYRSGRISLYPNCVRGPNDSRLTWPFTCQVTITVVSSNQHANNKVLSQSRFIEYISSHISRVQPFIFQLDEDSMPQDDCIVVKCVTKVIR